MFSTASVWRNLTRDCCENRDRRRSTSRVSWMCTVKRPRQWASSIPVRLCEKDFEWLSSSVKCATLDTMSRKIMFFGCFRNMVGGWRSDVSKLAWRIVVFVVWNARRIAQMGGKLATSAHQPQTRVINIGERELCGSYTVFTSSSRVIQCN